MGFRKARQVAMVASLGAVASCYACPAWAQQGGRVLPQLTTQPGGTLPVLPPIVSSTPRDESLIGVAERYRPEFQADGVKLGSFAVYPSIRGGVGYDTNIFAQNANKTDGALYVVEPVLTARSNWASSELLLQARGRFTDYFNVRNAAEPTYAFSGDGRFALSSPILVNVGASYSQQVERRDSSSFPTGTVGPVRFRVANGYVRGSYDLGTVRLVGTTDYTRFDFSDTKALNLDQSVAGILPQRFRDHDVLRTAGRVEGELSPRFALFLQGTFADINYRDPIIPGGAANRDATEYQVTAGANINIALLRGEIGVGYVHHNYKAAIYNTISGLALDARLTYFATPLLTVTAEASRTVEETSILTASGFFSTRFQAQADYELLRNLILNGGVSYRDNDFKGIDRQDHILRFTGGAKYLASRRINFDLDFFYIDRKVDGALGVPDFNEFRITTGVTFRL